MDNTVFGELRAIRSDLQRIENGKVPSTVRMNYSQAEALVEFLKNELGAFAENDTAGAREGATPTADEGILAVLKWVSQQDGSN